MHADTRTYNAALPPAERKTCELLAKEIERALPDAENKVWHAHPVWFLDGNPIVGYSRLKDRQSRSHEAAHSSEKHACMPDAPGAAAAAICAVLLRPLFLLAAVNCPAGLLPLPVLI